MCFVILFLGQRLKTSILIVSVLLFVFSQVRVSSERTSWTEKRTGSWRSLWGARSGFLQWGYGYMAPEWTAGNGQSESQGVFSYHWKHCSSNEVAWAWWKPDHRWQTAGTYCTFPLPAGDTQYSSRLLLLPLTLSGIRQLKFQRVVLMNEPWHLGRVTDHVKTASAVWNRSGTKGLVLPLTDSDYLKILLPDTIMEQTWHKDKTFFPFHQCPNSSRCVLFISSTFLKSSKYSTMILESLKWHQGALSVR